MAVMEGEAGGGSEGAVATIWVHSKDGGLIASQWPEIMWLLGIVRLCSGFYGDQLNDFICAGIADISVLCGDTMSKPSILKALSHKVLNLLP